MHVKANCLIKTVTMVTDKVDPLAAQKKPEGPCGKYTACVHMEYMYKVVVWFSNY